jgi:hypothetical protein
LDTTWLAGIAQDPLHFYTVAPVVFVIVVSALLALVRLPGVWVPIRTWLVMLPLALGALWIGAQRPKSERRPAQQQARPRYDPEECRA